MVNAKTVITKTSTVSGRLFALLMTEYEEMEQFSGYMARHMLAISEIDLQKRFNT